jgi:hypothetical protein
MTFRIFDYRPSSLILYDGSEAIKDNSIKMYIGIALINYVGIHMALYSNRSMI